MFEVFDPTDGNVYYRTKFYWLACVVCWFYGGSDMNLAGRGWTNTDNLGFPRIYNPESADVYFENHCGRSNAGKQTTGQDDSIA